jgi:hypothetical protein
MIPSSGMQQSTLESRPPGNFWPRPFVEVSTGINQNMALVCEMTIIFSVMDADGPSAGGSVPLCFRHHMRFFYVAT